MIKSQYTLDNEWLDARERLAGLERNEDPATIEYFQRIGVGEGWHCLEIGAGGGSIAEWLCRQVGPTGRVVATDINPRFLEALDYPNLEVWRHDLVSDDLPRGAFNMVHTRAVIMHIRERQRAMKKLTDALKPGGWILLEEPDHITIAADPMAVASSQSLFNKVNKIVNASWRERGQDIHVGNQLFGMLRELGFESLGAEGRVRVFQGGSPEVEFHRLTYQQLRDLVLTSGRMTEEEYTKFLALFDDPSFAFRFFLLMSAWGRKPQ
jgi:SAM-dependent methyltransferase